MKNTYAILGATGNCGSSLVQILLQTPDAKIHAYCRNKAKFARILPEAADNKRVTVFEGQITDVDLMASCIQGCKSIFVVATMNDNMPGCHVSEDSANTIIAALKQIGAKDPEAKMPKIVVLSSATIDPHLSRKMPRWFHPIMIRAGSFVYDDLKAQEKILREQSDWLTSIFIKPGGLAVDRQKGHKLDFDEHESFVGYLDLAAAMVEAADDPDGRYDMRNVGVMSNTSTVTAASQVRLSLEAPGLCRLAENPAGSLEQANKLLQKNHDDFHIFWRDINGHNHMAHALLTHFALGASPAELQRAFDDNKAVQRAAPPLDEEVVKKLTDGETFFKKLNQTDQYTNYLVFFEREIEKKGWREVLQEYCFSGTRNADQLLALLYEGAYHPIIHLGLGVEFEQPSIIAEGLAQAATHSSVGIDDFLFASEKEAVAAAADPASSEKHLVELIQAVRGNDRIRYAARWTDITRKVQDGVLGRAGKEIASLASHYRVKPQIEDIERKCAEMISCCAYMAGACQRPGKARKIDFFHMHNVTSSIFLTVFVRQPWISLETKARLVAWKGRLDLVWYAGSGAAELRLEDVKDYKGSPSGDWTWAELYKHVNSTHDDGHVAKFVRALKNGESAAKPFEAEEYANAFPIKGDMWLKVARMAYDTTLNLPPEAKWIWATGFDQAWGNIPSLS
ncbi:hypothetical protein GQ43DRAFT_455687 [Delitschia confertaspora ATCC 74209]|uniref:NAD(P)-binding domain-containing protein n=1 Tax=Delitschia confertaspora ATCC 74209 TaxID=1513339 RepID=A0A9P4JM15_9PLEO|nr:hypothetical protein GQ43DRAFT_455687 [Delitschia confertaspora ATCC 74209]